MNCILWFFGEVCAWMNVPQVSVQCIDRKVTKGVAADNDPCKCTGMVHFVMMRCSFGPGNDNSGTVMSVNERVIEREEKEERGKKE